MFACGGDIFFSAARMMSGAMRSARTSNFNTEFPRFILNSAVSPGRTKNVMFLSCVLLLIFFELTAKISSPTINPAFFAGAFSATILTTTFVLFMPSVSSAWRPNQLYTGSPQRRISSRILAAAFAGRIKLPPISAEENIRVIEAVGSDYIKVYFDIFNSQYYGHNTVRDLNLLGKRYIGEIHMKDKGHRLDSGSGMPESMQACIDAICGIGYEGWLVMELHGHNPKKDGSVEEVLKHNLEYLKKSRLFA